MHYQKEQKIMERYYILNAVELFGNSFVTPKLHSSVFCFTIDKN